MRVPFREAGGEMVPGNAVHVFTNPDLVLFRRTGNQFIWLKKIAEDRPLTRMDVILNWFGELDRQLH
jgi:hypothetical protein